jgi:micrococcal nuclease
MISGLLGTVGGVIILILMLWLVFNLIHSLIKVAIIGVVLLLIANFVFGWTFGLGAVWDFATSHTDVSEEGLTFSLDNPLNMQSATVTRVIDGDTIELSSGDKVRLLGINAPESGLMCAYDAQLKLSELVFNKTVYLEMDEEDTDAYGRLLRYVWIDDNLVNAVLIEEGLAHVYVYGAELKHADIFYSAQDEAIAKESCLWEASDYKDCITIVTFNYDAPGDDNDNLNQEFVKLKNNCEDLNLNGWTIKDESASNLYTFSLFTLASEKQFTVYTGEGEDYVDTRYWGNSRAIWNNDADTLFMRDNVGKLVLLEHYESE